MVAEIAQSVRRVAAGSRVRGLKLDWAYFPCDLDRLNTTQLPTQHTTNTWDENACPQRDSNSQSLQSISCWPTPQTARPPESAKDIINQVIFQVFHYDVCTAAMLLPLILQNWKLWYLLETRIPSCHYNPPDCLNVTEQDISRDEPSDLSFIGRNSVGSHLSEGVLMWFSSALSHTCRDSTSN